MIQNLLRMDLEVDVAMTGQVTNWDQWPDSQAKSTRSVLGVIADLIGREIDKKKCRSKEHTATQLLEGVEFWSQVSSFVVNGVRFYDCEG